MVSSGIGRGGAMHRFIWFAIPNTPRELSDDVDGLVRRALLEALPECATGEGVESCWAIMTEKKILGLERSREVVSKLKFVVFGRGDREVDVLCRDLFQD